MGLEELRLTRGSMQIGPAQRRLIAASGRKGSVRCVTSQDKQSALSAHARGFMRRLPNDRDGAHRYELTDLGCDVLTVLTERGLIDG